MGKETKIEWTDHTFNPWIGCAKVSAGCANCYAEVSTPARAMGIPWGKGAKRHRTSAALWKEPFRWNQEAWMQGIPRKVFCASLADWLDDEVPSFWLAELMQMICLTPHLKWQLLTKRPENLRARLFEARQHMLKQRDDRNWERAADMVGQWIHEGLAPEHVHFGVSVEDQESFDKRIPALMAIPATVRFLSVEPLIGPIDLTGAFGQNVYERARGFHAVNWVIVGGESGPKARPCQYEWLSKIAQQCREACVPCFVKQFGSNVVKSDMTAGLIRHPLKHPKGGDPSEWPEWARVREFP